jgi:hypothetical protein
MSVTTTPNGVGMGVKGLDDSEIWLQDAHGRWPRFGGSHAYRTKGRPCASPPHSTVCWPWRASPSSRSPSPALPRSCSTSPCGAVAWSARCAHFSSWARYDTRAVTSSWRHLDFGRWQVFVRAGLRRLRCPEHGVRVEGVPFARARSRFSRDFEDLVAFLATKTDKRTIARLSRVDWDTVGRVCERVVAHGLDPERLDGLVNIGVDEVSWRRHHNYLTLVAEHTSKKIVWGAPGKDTATLDAFFDDLGPERAAQLQAVSMDMGAAFNKSVRAARARPAGRDLYRPLPRCPAGHRRPGRRAPRRMERTTSPTRPGRGQEVQRRPLGAAKTAREPQRRPVRHPAKTAPPRRGRLARLHPQRDLPRHLRRRPGHRRHGRAA